MKCFGRFSPATAWIADLAMLSEQGSVPLVPKCSGVQRERARGARPESMRLVARGARGDPSRTSWLLAELEFNATSGAPHVTLVPNKGGR